MKTKPFVDWIVANKLAAGIALALVATVGIISINKMDSNRYKVSLVSVKDRGQTLESLGIGKTPWGAQVTEGRFIEVAVNVKDKEDPDSPSGIKDYDFSVTDSKGNAFDINPLLFPWETEKKADLDMMFEIPSNSKDLKLNFSTSYYDSNLRKIKEKKIIDLGI